MDWSRISSRWKRLHSMSLHEIADRSRQQITARADLLRYKFHRELEPEFRIPEHRPAFFFSPDSVSSVCALLRERFPQQAASIIQRAERICEHRFDLLGHENLHYGPNIDWHLDLVHGKRAPSKPWYEIQYLNFDEVGDSKVTWELNRHQHLVTLAKACRLTARQE